MRTGQTLNTGAGRIKKPAHYLEKYYPIEGRKDFYKWVIVTPTGLAKDWQGKEMYFDSFNLELAKTTLKAIRKVARTNKKFLN